jgi:hypothetical protein
MKRTSILFLLLGVLVLQDSWADDKPSIADLAGMTGSWAGPIGTATLEENWSQARDGSIASLVRMTAEGATSMVELIVIEEEGDSLVLRIQQWDPGFSPRSPGPQKMDLTAISENTVSFKAASPGSLKNLTYARPAADKFTIHVELEDGTLIDLELQAQ